MHSESDVSRQTTYLGVDNILLVEKRRKKRMARTIPMRLFDYDLYQVLFMPSPRGLMSDLCSKNVAVGTPTLPK